MSENEAQAAVDTNLGEAITTLQSSMHNLSEEMSALGDATQSLQASTIALSEQQRMVSEDMATTADEITKRTRAQTTMDHSRSTATADD
jgi:cell division septum initiation protein DivIVA